MLIRKRTHLGGQVLTIGDRFPNFSLTALKAGNLQSLDVSAPEDYFTTIDSGSYAGQWRVVFFWPKDFTFVCPTEIAEFGRLNEEFADRDAQVLGVSVDNEYVHHAWRRHHEDLRDLPFPMLSDVKRELTSALGVLNSDGVADRATFLVDPAGVIQFVMVTAGSVGRNVSEVLRVLDALQTDELCPCNWRKGAQTLDAAELLEAA
jgi:peroxiredoxin (alkyl hydroperoxide reductase subunit C)